MRAESTRSLMIGLFVVTGRTELTAAELVRLARCRGVSSSNLKCHLTRMVQDGSLVRRGAPRSFLYAPSPAKQRVIKAIRTRMSPAEESWTNEWILLAPTRPSAGGRRRLVFDGFRAVNRGAFARPAWPRSWAVARAEAHVERDGGAFTIGPLTGICSEAGWLRVYTLERLARRAAKVGERVARLLATPPMGERALALRLELGEEIARLFALDPRLPPVLWGGRDPLAELARAHARLERVLGRASAPFLASVLASRASMDDARTA
jgi:DNA-binding transcriptional regulator PaaX